MTGQETLPRGRHGLSEAEIRASQRERLFGSLLELIGEHGWRNVTVTDVVRRARVSKSAFYAQFRGKDEAFIAAAGEFAESVLADMVAHCLTATSALEATVLGNQFIGAFQESRRNAAKALFLELPKLGPDADAVFARLRAGWEVAFTETAEWFRAEDPTLPKLLPHASHAVIMGSQTLLAEAVADGGPEAVTRAREAIFGLWLIAAAGRIDHDGRLPTEVSQL